MNIPQLDRLNLNPFKYRHEDFKYSFKDLTHLEHLQGSKFKSEYYLDQNTKFELKDIDEVNKELKIYFSNTDSLFVERTCNTLFKELSTDDLEDDEFTELDYKIIRDTPEGYNLRSWHKDLFSLHLNCIGFENVYISVKTTLEP